MVPICRLSYIGAEELLLGVRSKHDHIRQRDNSDTNSFQRCRVYSVVTCIELRKKQSVTTRGQNRVGPTHRTVHELEVIKYQLKLRLMQTCKYVTAAASSQFIAHYLQKNTIPSLMVASGCFIV
jgi:hypothetical protein